MSAYVSVVNNPVYAKPVTNRNMLMSSNGTTNRRAETRVIKNSLFSGVSGVLIAFAFAWMNAAPVTTPAQNNIGTIKAAATPVISRNAASKKRDESVKHIEESNALQELFGFNTAQWARLLKVERKTVYNWKHAPETKIKTSAADRIAVLKQFADEFNPKHKAYFSKFIFGRNADKKLLDAFFRDPLDLNELLDLYDDIYVKLDGFVKRKALLGD